jgi:hypothetical protein
MRRWPVIRFVRFLILAWRFCRWWEHFGRHHWAIPNPGDLEYLEDVRKGQA